MRASARTVLVVVSLLMLALGLALDRRSTLAAYLVAWIAMGAIPLGAWKWMVAAA